MVTHFLELQEAAVAVIRSKELSGLKERDVTSLTNDEVVAAEEMIGLLKPMKDITVTLSSETVPTASLLMPLYNSLVGPNGHLSLKEGDSDLIASMKETMSRDLHGRYDAETAKLCMISALFTNFGFLSEESATESTVPS